MEDKVIYLVDNEAYRIEEFEGDTQADLEELYNATQTFSEGEVTKIEADGYDTIEDAIMQEYANKLGYTLDEVLNYNLVFSFGFNNK